MNHLHRKEIEKWADGPVEFHFANILSPWIRRALVAGGFGMATSDRLVPAEVAPVFTHHLSSTKGVFDNFTTNSDTEANYSHKEINEAASAEERVEPVLSAETPFFHFDLDSAVRCAEQALNKL